ncbi:cadherin-like protein 26 isoform X2 [Carcharodon carcharias]|uniref:cadherin-like protein 26 isoform X2 n=1 Tax=Carcharodon carcharias TaxID=13397 RepID=UPI001B7F6C0B|nr:cadherin-like protein 26 isoform X2 [Carcharodon carcharias]
MHISMEIRILLFFLSTVTVIHCTIHNDENHQISWNFGTQEGEEVKPVILCRQKRMWVLGTIHITEEDKGPFPKVGIRINNDRSVQEKLIFRLSGDGVDIAPELGLFYLNPSTGLIMINRTVDREKTPTFSLNIDALSAQTSEKVDQTLKYLIRVKDINDNAPIFNDSRYEVNVPENAAEGKEIFRVNATDKDEKNNPNSHISYSLISQKPSKDSSHFHINGTNGAISFTGCLNYERVKSYLLTVKARDNGENILSSTVTVQINVTDSNNNLPAFIRTGSFSGQVKENDEHVTILRVSVTDKDNPKTPAWRAKYNIIEGNEHGNYKIETDPETNDGILSLVKHLNYEGGSKRQLKISVENEEMFFSCSKKTDDQKADALDSVSVVVNVYDINDAPVVHPPEVTVQLPEGLKLNKELVKFNATAHDKLITNNIRFVKAYDPEGWVTVNEKTGVVTTVCVLDRESPYVKESIYKVVVHAVDDGRPPQTGSGTLNILLMDINDNKPRLVSTYEKMCDDGGIQHVTLTAKDDDMNPFSGPFHFELLDNEQNIKEKWKLDQEIGYSVKLVRMKKIPIGNYIIPLNIRDREGVGTKNTLQLWVCHCNNGSTCPHSSPTSVTLGAGAIGLFFGALLLVLLGFLLILFMKKKSFEVLPCEYFKGTLINYNNEGPCEITSRIAPKLSIGKGSALDSEAKSSFDESRPDHQFGRSKVNLEHPPPPQEIHIGLKLGPSIITSPNPGNIPGFWKDGDLTQCDAGVKKVGEIIYRRLNVYNAREDTQEHYQPHVYQYEGEENKTASLDSITIVESNAGFCYLDNLEPNFIALVKICQQKN